MKITQQHITNANKIMRFQTQTIKAQNTRILELEFKLATEEVISSNLQAVLDGIDDMSVAIEDSLKPKRLLS